MKQMLKAIRELVKLPEEQIREKLQKLGSSSLALYPDSLNKAGDCLLMVASDRKSKFLLAVSEKKNGIIANFAGGLIEDSGLFARKCPFSPENAVQIRKLFPWTAPVSLRKKKTTIGCGDRLGRATPGHISAIRKFDASPVLAQQSMRELSLTGRTYVNVIDDVSFLVYQEGFRDGFGADGDHLKKMEDVDTALDAGATMITVDLSDAMKTGFATKSPAEIDSAFAQLPLETRERVKGTYFDRNVVAGALNFVISPADAKRCALIYAEAMDFAAELGRRVRKRKGGDGVDLEISIDETTCPTKLEDHFFIVNELAARKLDFVSVAPRFVGEFQKGIDYIGDVNLFEEQFAKHAELARGCGNYKISVHSGSDKFSVFPAIGRLTRSRLHLKTAGTSWLEAVRVVSISDPGLYRRMHQKALDSFADAKRLYHVTTDLSKVKSLSSVSDAELPDYLAQNESRQLLHITYGAILSDKSLGPAFFSCIGENEKLYIEKLDVHFTRHLSELGIKRR